MVSAMGYGVLKSVCFNSMIFNELIKNFFKKVLYLQVELKVCLQSNSEIFLNELS